MTQKVYYDINSPFKDSTDKTFLPVPVPFPYSLKKDFLFFLFFKKIVFLVKIVNTGVPDPITGSGSKLGKNSGSGSKYNVYESTTLVPTPASYELIAQVNKNQCLMGTKRNENRRGKI